MVPRLEMGSDSELLIPGSYLNLLESFHGS